MGPIAAPGQAAGGPLTPAAEASPTRPLAVGVDARYLDRRFPGIGRYVFALLRALPAALGPHATVRALVPAEPAAPRFPLAALHHAGVETVASRLPVRSLREQVVLPARSRQLACDLWHAPYLVTAYRPARPLAVTVFDLIALEDPAFLPSLRSRLAFRLLVRLAVRAARTVLTLSEHAGRTLQRRLGLDPARIAVTPAGVEEAFRPPPPAAVEALRARLDLPARYVLHLGIDKPHKNLARLVDAWATLDAERRGDACLLLAGYRDPRYPGAGERLRQRCPHSARVLGAVDDRDLPALYGGATLFVLPSLSEGFGLPLLEAMACGTAVACADAGSLPEVAGDAAARFDPRDTAAIAATLAALLGDRDRRQALAAAGRARARTFTWARTAAGTAAAYRRMLAAGSER